MGSILAQSIAAKRQAYDRNLDSHIHEIHSHLNQLDKVLANTEKLISDAFATLKKLLVESVLVMVS
jgi:hypothetical protein